MGETPVSGYPDGAPGVFSELREAVESRDEAAVKACFCEDCKLEILEYGLSGHDGVKKWLDWMYKHMKSMKTVPIDCIWDGERMFEEYSVRGVLHNGVKVQAKQARIIYVEDGRIKHLRSYFDRLAFADSMIHGNTFQKVVRKFIDKSMGELAG